MLVSVFAREYLAGFSICQRVSCWFQYLPEYLAGFSICQRVSCWFQYLPQSILLVSVFATEYLAGFSICQRVSCWFQYLPESILLVSVFATEYLAGFSICQRVSCWFQYLPQSILLVSVFAREYLAGFSICQRVSCWFQYLPESILLVSVFAREYLAGFSICHRVSCWFQYLPHSILLVSVFATEYLAGFSICQRVSCWFQYLPQSILLVSVFATEYLAGFSMSAAGRVAVLSLVACVLLAASVAAAMPARLTVGAVLSSQAHVQHFTAELGRLAVGLPFCLNASAVVLDVNPIGAARSLCEQVVPDGVVVVIAASRSLHSALSPKAISFTCGFYRIPVIGIAARDSAFSDKVSDDQHEAASHCQLHIGVPTCFILLYVLFSISTLY